MTAVIDSKETQLEPAQIIMKFAENYNSTGYPAEVVTAAIMKEITMPNVDLVQFGNTAFIGHRGKGKNKDLMWGRGLTVDTAQNFIAAGLKYFTYLQKLGVKRYVSDYDGPVYDSAFKTWKRYADRLIPDTKIAVGRTADGDSRAYITLGPTPITGT